MAAFESVRIAWEGDFQELHSLALVNRAICRELIRRGHDVRMIRAAALAGTEPHGMAGANGKHEKRDFRRAKGDDQGPALVHVRHQWPPKLEPPLDRHWALMQPWEYGSVPKAWLPLLRRVDEVWAYSRYVRDCYLGAEVPRERVHVIPLGVDPGVYRPRVEPLGLPAGPEIRFLFVGGTIFRKGIDVLLKAFSRAFRATDGVGLVIKEMGSKSFYQGQTAEAQVSELLRRGYPVEYIDRNLSEAEMAGLYSACDCLVHPFRGEGFGLPIVEAMACGLPVIVTGAGPALDYAGEETAYLIPAERHDFAECRVGEIETIGRPWLFEPDADVLVELLRRVASDRAGARAKGIAASAHIRDNFTWARTADAVERRLLALASEVGQPFQAGTGSGGPDPQSGPSQAGSAEARTDLHRTADAGPIVVRASRLLFQTEQARRLHHNDAQARRLHHNDAQARRLHHNHRAKTTLTMIVRDEEKNLPTCLRSVEGLFDEVVIVDTGSKDRTREVAHELGARVFHFVWVADFAAARNAALARATGDYAFWLDADDVIDPPEREKLEALLADLGAAPPRSGEPPCEPHSSMAWEGEPLSEPHSSTPRHVSLPARTEPRPPGVAPPPDRRAAYVVKCSCDPGPKGEGGQTVVDHVRLFPVREDIRWSYRVHEQILPAVRRAKIPVHWSDVVVRHTGYTDRALRLRKLDRDAGILQEELAERPRDPFVLFNLGAIAIERHEWRQAIDHLRRSLAGSAPSDSITRKLYALIARAHQMLGEPRPAIAACAEGLAIDPDDAELTFREAVIRRHIHDNEGAERCWRRILTVKRPEQFASVDQGIYGHLTRRNFAALARERGDHAEEAELWRAVLEECPGDREALSCLREFAESA